MNFLPKELENIIIDYQKQLEVWDTYTKCIQKLKNNYVIIKYPNGQNNICSELYLPHKQVSYNYVNIHYEEYLSICNNTDTKWSCFSTKFIEIEGSVITRITYNE